MKIRLCAAAIAVLSLLSTLPVSAHHSLLSEFDREQTLTLKGVMTSIEWINPHIFMYVDVTDAGGKTTWAVETYPPNHMRSKYGLTKAVLAGNTMGKGEVTVELNPAANGKKLGWLTKITYPEGNFIKLTVDPDSAEAR